MLSPKPQLNLQSARQYFREHLSVGDYYAEGHSISGDWSGEAAARLGLTGNVGERQFLELCEGMNPLTGEWLTVRRNSTRFVDGSVAANRRVFYDFTFSPPKSVSVVALFQDVRIIELHTRAVRAAMQELEKFAETRVRKDGEEGDRTTGNLVVASFRHDTSRELDPHLHTHCIVFNATFDPVENRWKALQAAGMYRAQKFAENHYYHELAKGLRLLGYEIENNARDFEIKGVPAQLIERFSKRHRQIDEETRKRVEKEGLRGNVKALRRQVAHDERKRKIKGSTADRLRPSWASQMTAQERSALNALVHVRPQRLLPADADGIVAWADEHLFERRSVVAEHELWSAALAHGRGKSIDLEALKQAVMARKYIRDQDRSALTSRDILRCELDIVLAAREGRHRHRPFNPGHVCSARLSVEQIRAVKQILDSRDTITLFRGGAGTGKSLALTDVTGGLAAAGHPVLVLAPQRQQVSDLAKSGLAAQTVAQVLATGRIPHNAVIVVDEAGQIGGRQFRDLIRLVGSRQGRLILSGDTRQHGAVAASDALRAIEQYGRLNPAEIQEVRRQAPVLGKTRLERRAIREYRTAVKAAAAGDIEGSFERLDRMGWIRELGEGARRTVLAREYVAAVGRNENPLVVAQTWREVCQVNEAVREELKAAEELGTGRVLTVYQPVDGTQAQKREARFYAAGQRAMFLKRYGRFAKGDSCEIAGANARGVVLLKNGRRSTLGYRQTGRIIVANSSEMEIAPGDRLQLKFNGRSAEGLPLNNGELVTVDRVQTDGAIVVRDDAGRRKTLAPTQRLFHRGFAVTSYGSQGKTVDTVFLADAANPAATNRNQWYVAISRARRRVIVFTSDKAALRADVQRIGDRRLALDLKPDAGPQNGMANRAAPRLPAWTRRAWAIIQQGHRQRFVARWRMRAASVLSETRSQLWGARQDRVREAHRRGHRP